MLFKLIREEQQTAFQRFEQQTAPDLKLTEKDLENWMAKNPDLLFGNEKVLVIAQSVSGQSMGDILALDADGRLIIVEIKRDWSNRATVGQLLEYAARMTGSSYEDLEKLHHRYRSQQDGKNYRSLIDRFRKELTDDPTVNKETIPKREKGHRICIVAPGSDEGLSLIVEWLKEYGVPISFVPFTLYTDTVNNNGDILLEIEPLPVPEDREDSEHNWQGDCFFNTNETWGPGAYQRMFEQGVIAIYGFAGGPTAFEQCAKGQRVFAYVNGKGILAMGEIVDGQAIPGNTVFAEFGEDEFHVKVKWEVTVAEDQGIKLEDVKEKFNYGLPVRNIFCRMPRHDIANWIADKLQQRKAPHDYP